MAADDRKGAYAEVEHLKKGKWRIKRDYNRLNIVIAAAIAITLLFFFTGDLFSSDIYAFSPFAALTGHEDAIRETQRRMEERFRKMEPGNGEKTGEI